MLCVYHCWDRSFRRSCSICSVRSVNYFLDDACFFFVCVVDAFNDTLSFYIASIAPLVLRVGFLHFWLSSSHLLAEQMEPFLLNSLLIDSLIDFCLLLFWHPCARYGYEIWFEWMRLWSPTFILFYFSICIWLNLKSHNIIAYGVLGFWGFGVLGGGAEP